MGRTVAIFVALAAGSVGCEPSYAPNDIDILLAIARDHRSYGDVDEPIRKDSGR